MNRVCSQCGVILSRSDVAIVLICVKVILPEANLSVGYDRLFAI